MEHRMSALLLCCAAAASGLAVGQNESEVDAAIESEVAARALAMEMAALLGDSPAFAVDMNIGYDTMQEDGQKVEFGERRTVSLQRPSQVRNELLSSDGTQETIVFDGKSITVSEAGSNVYARTAQPGDIDTTVKYFLGQLGMRLPLAAMLMQHFPDELARRMVDVQFVEETDILGENAYHLAGRTSSVDFQVWISTGEQPIPYRIILTYRNSPGQPQFRANFQNWNFKPDFAPGTFSFKPPASATEIPLIAHLVSGTTGEAATTTSMTGETP